ncbi:MAG TPA: 50S ribosomal protein L32 [Armatimonadota bacterium]|jgi:large subunit ribosomal protein L32
MALPKRRHSNTRTRKRRCNQVLGVVTVARCPHCKAYTRPHNACPKCGYYQGEKVDHTVQESKSKQAH